MSFCTFVWNSRHGHSYAFDPGLMKRALPDTCSHLSSEETAAVCIQKHFRGCLGRKIYLAELLKNFEKEERLRREKTLEQLEEGELLLENHKLEVEFEENHCLRRNREQRRLAHILTIQRAWRKYKRVQRKIKSSCNLDHHRHHRNTGKPPCNVGHPSFEDVNGNHVRVIRPAAVTIDEQGTSKEPHRSPPIAEGDMSKSMNSKSPVYTVSDLGSDLEIDHLNPSVDTSPETPSRGKAALVNCNRLSLAEEFATMEENILDGGKGVLESEDDESDYYGGSSEVTTPEWDRPEISLRGGESPARSPGDGGNSSKRTTIIEDPNRNPSKSDLNANLKTTEGSRVRVREGVLSSENMMQYTSAEGKPRGSTTTNPPSLDKRKLGEEVNLGELESQTGKVSCGSVVRTGSDTTLSSYLSDTEQSPSTMELSTSSSSTATNTAAAAQSSTSSTKNLPKVEVEVSAVKEKCPTCEGVQGVGVGIVAPTPLDGDIPVPVLDWESLERHLAKMEVEEKNKKQNKPEEVVVPVQPSPRQIQKNSRLAILRKLAMGEEDIEGDIYGKGRDKLSSRLQSGMNLQICFVNDSVDGSDAEEEPTTAVPRVANRDSRFLFSRESSVGSPSTGTSPKTPSVTFEDLEDFESKQARLQAETRIALAQVKEVVKLQMELDRQQRKKSPTTELAGVSGLSDISEGLSNNHFDRDLLQTMSISKLQFIANELHSKIEKLNEELVQLLMARDELQNGQDSQLVDIEDLTRWIRMNMHQTNNNTLLSGHEPMTNINPRRKQAEQTLLKLLGRSLPASGRKCICGVSRSSSVVSNRSVSSPEPEPVSRNPLSPTSPQSCRSESSVGESHASSPELTWVRQTFVRYWYN